MPAITYELIGTATASGSSPTLLVSSIPNTYTHLQIITNLRSSDGRSGGQSASVYFNNDTSSSYNKLANDNNYGYYQGNTSAIEFSCIMNGSTANSFWQNEATICQYKNTSMYKWIWMRTGTGVFNSVSYQNGLYRSLNVISSVYCTEPSNLNWVAGSTLSVYGIKGE